MSPSLPKAQIVPKPILSKRKVGALAFLVIALACHGCARPSAERNAPAPSGATLPALPRAGVRGAESGLEMRWWVVDDSDGIIGRTLAPYADRPIPIHQSVRDLWRANGLRIVSMPASRVGSLRPGLWQAAQAEAGRRSGADGPNALVREPIVGRPQEEWLGERPAWSDIIRGPMIDCDMRIVLDSGEMIFTPGRTRLLARCWTIPLPGPQSRIQPGMRLELAIQHEDPPDPEQRLWDPHYTAPPIEAQGLVFSRLVLEMIALEGEAIVIVPESPHAQWDEVDTSGADSGPESGPMSGPETGPESGPERRTTLPPASPLPTLGECLLSFPSLVGARPTRKAVLVLIPRLPDEYSLIAR